NFWRNKVFSLINISGLAIGISAAIIIFLIVQYEFSFDNFHKNKERIYRVVSIIHFPNQEFKNSGVPMPLPPAVQKEVTGLESSAAVYGYGATRIAVNDPKNVVQKNQDNIILADENYFKIFTYEWIAGNA